MEIEYNYSCECDSLCDILRIIQKYNCKFTIDTLSDKYDYDYLYEIKWWCNYKTYDNIINKIRKYMATNELDLDDPIY